MGKHQFKVKIENTRDRLREALIVDFGQVFAILVERMIQQSLRNMILQRIHLR